MSLPHLESFVNPGSIEEAYAALGPHSRPVSGGTDVMLRTPDGCTTLVDLMGLPLAEITAEAGGFRVGANATLSAVLEHHGLAAHLRGIVPEMMVHVGSPLLRNAATLGGHLARGRMSDVVPVLVALDAEVEWYDGNYRRAPLTDFYAAGAHQNPMLITAVGIPPLPGNAAGGFHKMLRTFFDLALVNAACVLRLDATGRVDHLRVVVGGTPALAVRVTGAEDALLGAPPGPGAFAEAAAIARSAVETRDNSMASAEYRTQLVGVAVERCLARAASRLEGAS